MRTPRLIPALAILIAVVVASCGSSNKTSPTAPGGVASTSSATASSSPSGSAVTVIASKHNAKMGMILAGGPKQLTVYLFEADKPGTSNCTGACASLWPPVTGKPRAAGAAVAADLGTISRPDGTTQITYKGHPLYYYAKDGDSRDAYGEAIKSFGAEWYVLRPSGSKVDLS